MNEHRPARRSHRKLYRHFPAVRSETVATLSASHAIQVAALIELRSARAQSQHRSIARRERDLPIRRVKLQLLDQVAALSFDADRERVAA